MVGVTAFHRVGYASVRDNLPREKNIATAIQHCQANSFSSSGALKYSPKQFCQSVLTGGRANHTGQFQAVDQPKWEKLGPKRVATAMIGFRLS